MTHTTQIQLFQIFRQKFGEKEAEIIVETLEKTVDNKMEANRNTYLTKDDKIELIREIREVKVETVKWMVSLFLTSFITLALMIIGLYFKK